MKGVCNCVTRWSKPFIFIVENGVMYTQHDCSVYCNTECSCLEVGDKMTELGGVPSLTITETPSQALFLYRKIKLWIGLFIKRKVSLSLTIVLCKHMANILEFSIEEL